MRASTGTNHDCFQKNFSDIALSSLLRVCSWVAAVLFTSLPATWKATEIGITQISAIKSNNGC